MIERIGKIGMEWFKARGISPETLSRFAIHTGKLIDGHVRGYTDGNIICFPYFRDQKVGREKYRQLPKKFWQAGDGPRMFWNEEVLELAEGKELIITEGEIDALTAIDCGFDVTVSVPDGAPEQAVDIDTDRDGGKFSYLWAVRHELALIKTFVLAVDNDASGKVLAAELARRLSAARCKFVEYPPDCKDLNDVLVKHGRAEVIRVLRGAREYPLTGMYRLADYPEKPPLQLSETGWSALDKLISPFPGELMVITGIPGHGKSSFAMNLISNMCDINGWSAAIFSPEMPLIPFMHEKLRRIRVGRRADWTLAKTGEADQWINDHLLFLDADPSGQWDAEDTTLDWIIERTHEAVLRYGIRILLIDPWNEVEHSRRKDELMTDYVGRSLRELRHLAQQRGIIVMVVAHPTKDIAKEKRPPGLYDIDGSAHWANKPDHGISVYRADNNKNSTDVYVNKVRFGMSGKRGMVVMDYDVEGESYSVPGVGLYD